MSGTAASAIEAQLAVSHPGFGLAIGFELPGHGFSALFGPSGSGKTSCLRAIAGLQRAAGRLRVGDEVWQDDARGVFVAPQHRSVGMVFQQGALFAHLSVRGNLEFARRRAPRGRPAIAFDQVLALLGLEPLLARMPAHLSGGERQRVAIGRALAASPKLLLLDEPLASLDLPRRAELLPCLQAIRAALDIPAILVSHAPDEVATLARHVVVIGSRGAGAPFGALASGPAAEVLTRLDLALAHGDAAQAALAVTVLDHDPVDRLARHAFDGGELFLPSAHATPGARGIVRVMARDVSLTLARHPDTSILNILPATVLELADDAPGQVMVRLAVGAAPPAGAGRDGGAAKRGSVLLARVSQRSAHALGLRPGLAVQAQIKAAALSA